jgi:hypothetical protein
VRIELYQYEHILGAHATIRFEDQFLFLIVRCQRTEFFDKNINNLGWLQLVGVAISKL